MDQKTDELEAMLRRSVPIDHAHKEALRARLFGETAELGPDDLAAVAGGVATDQQKPLDWPNEETIINRKEIKR